MYQTSKTKKNHKNLMYPDEIETQNMPMYHYDKENHR